MAKKKVDTRPSRINLEPSLFDDVRFHRLVQLCGGDPEKALGKWGFFVKEAQRYWKKGELIPQEIIRIGGFEPVIEAGLGEVREDGIYAKGAFEHFSWLVASRANGKKGGRPKKTGNPEKPRGNPEEPKVEKGNLEKPSYSYSHSNTEFSLRSNSVLPAVAALPPAAPAQISLAVESFSPTNPADKAALDPARVLPISPQPKPSRKDPRVPRCIGFWTQAYERTKGNRPAVKSWVVKRILEAVGSEVAFQRVVEAFLQMPGEKDFFERRAHTLDCLEANLDVVLSALSRGDPNAPGKQDWSRVFPEELKAVTSGTQ